MKPVKPSLGIDTEGISIPVDVDKLVESRLLLTATSGAGKSWALRRILEQTHGHVQHIIIDPEGEFYTLREIFDYVLARAGNEGERDCGISVGSAGLLATRLLELGVSTVVDIYDFKPAERTSFVQFFLESIMNAKRNLWRPVLIVIDEAHMFCPQTGESESGSAVAHLMSGGRKRGFAGCLATQRYSKLHKDASSMCKNVMIGSFTLDVDVKRAVESLGFVGRDAGAQIMSLQPGQFFVNGPAFCREVRLVKVGNVQTTHPKAGQRAPMPAVPRATIRSVLEKLTDLPGEAQKQAKTEAELRGEVRRLELQISKLEREAGKSTIDPQAVINADFSGYSRAVSEITTRLKHPLEGALKDLNAILQALTLIEKVQKTRDSPNARCGETATGDISKTPGFPRETEAIYGLPGESERQANERVQKEREAANQNGEPKLKRGARRLLAVAVTWYGKGLPEGEWRSKAGLRKSGSYATNKSALKTQGLIDFREGRVFATEKALQEFGGVLLESPQTTAEVLALWKPKLKKGAREMLDKLIEANRPVSKDELSEMTGLAISGSFATNISQLNTAGLINKEGKNLEVNREVLFL